MFRITVIGCCVLGSLLFPSRLSAQAQWSSDDVGEVGIVGDAKVANGVWTIRGAGDDVWNAADGFQFVHHQAPIGGTLMVRINELDGPHPFAKAGLMIRRSMSPSAASVVLSVKPNHELEFMSRATDGAQMEYLTGAMVRLPVWLQLSWNWAGPDHLRVAAATSGDGQSWVGLGETTAAIGQAYPGFGPPAESGAFVSSHDRTSASVASAEGLSLVPLSRVDVGARGLTGNALLSTDRYVRSLTVQAAGADIWGTSDAFSFVPVSVPHWTRGDAGWSSELAWTVDSLDAAHPYAKAGVMYRDGVEPDAPMVILSVKPNAEIEFMARLCRGCETTYLGGVLAAFPVTLSLVETHDGSTFEARVLDSVYQPTVLGEVTLSPAEDLQAGLAVTSHDPDALATAVISGLPLAYPSAALVP